MSDVPERIWIHPADPMQLYAVVEVPPTNAIPYRRDDQVCVWNQTSYTVESFSAGTFPVEAYVPQCSEFTETDMPHVDEHEGDYCPYCGNRILVEEA